MEYVITGRNKVILTENEVKVVKDYADGKSVAEIGKELGLSPRTIEAMFSRLRDKMDCKTSVNLVATFIRNKIIE